MELVPEEASASAAIPEAEPSTSASKTIKYMTKKDLESLLTQREQELAIAQVEISRRDKTICNLTSKNNQLVDSIKVARSAAREAKQYAKGVAEDAARSAQKFRDEVAVAEEREREKEAQWKEEEKRWNDKVDHIKDIEQVSSDLNIIAFQQIIFTNISNPLFHSSAGSPCTCCCCREEKGRKQVVEQRIRIKVYSKTKEHSH